MYLCGVINLEMDELSRDKNTAGIRLSQNKVRLQSRGYHSPRSETYNTKLFKLSPSFLPVTRNKAMKTLQPRQDAGCLAP
jgi:hypothetical protein